MSEPRTSEGNALLIQNFTAMREAGKLLEEHASHESYNISAIFGLPDVIPDKPVEQVLTHGLGNETFVIALKDATHFW